jgi:hypothetical protein
MTIDNSDSARNKRGADTLNRKTDTLVRELLETETQLTQKALQQMRIQYRKDKENWVNIYESQGKESESLRQKLLEAEQRLKQLQDEYVQNRIEEMEKLSSSAKQAQEKEHLDKEKWSSVEEQVKTYKQIALDTQRRLLEEEKNLIALRNEFSSREKELAGIIEERNADCQKLKEGAANSEENWLKDRSRYEEDIKRLDKQVFALQEALDLAKGEHLNVAGKKDEELARLQLGLREMVVQLTEERSSNRNLNNELQNRDRRINELEAANEKFSEQLGRERRQWQDELNREKNERIDYEHELTERESGIKRHTEEQVKHLMNMFSTLEIQLKIERQNRENLEKQNSVLRREKELLDTELEKFKKRREQEIILLNDEISELQAGVKEEKQLYELEKEEKQKLERKLSESAGEMEKLDLLIGNERKDREKYLAQERQRYDRRIEELNLRTEDIKKTRGDEIKRLEEGIETLNGELTEMKAVYYEKKVENEENLMRLQEYEILLGKQLDSIERERQDWETTLAREQEQWEKGKAAVLEREEKLREEREKEIKRLEEKVTELTAKISEYEHLIHKKNRETVRENERPGKFPREPEE